MYCIDTNIAIEFLRGNKEIINKIMNIQEQNKVIFISSISVCELYKGYYLYSRKDKELEAIQGFISNLSFLTLEEKSCKIFGEEFAKLQKIGKTTQEPDLMIASIAKSNNLTLITRDKKHFNNMDFQVEQW